MGAEKPALSKTNRKPQKFRLLLPVAAAVMLLGAGLFWMVYAQAEEAVQTTLSPREESRLQKRLRELDDSEQYALVAEINGWYPCLHSGRTTYYLLAGEVWKYGVTSKGKMGRYPAEFCLKTRFTIRLSSKAITQNVSSKSK